MNENSETHIWKIRTIKNYPEAHNHLLVGRVLETTDSYVRLHCRSYHFGRTVRQPEDIKIGNVCVRVVPWSRVEIVNELSPTFDYIKNTLIAADEGLVLFTDGKNAEPIGTSGRFSVSY